MVPAKLLIARSVSRLVSAIEITHSFDYLFLETPRCGQLALRGHRNSQLAYRLQGIKVTLAQLLAAPRDHLFLEFARRDEPTLRPQTIGQFEHHRERLRMLLAEYTTLLSQQTLVLFASLRGDHLPNPQLATQKNTPFSRFPLGDARTECSYFRAPKRPPGLYRFAWKSL